jgi:beta-mannanase
VAEDHVTRRIGGVAAGGVAITLAALLTGCTVPAGAPETRPGGAPPGEAPSPTAPPTPFPPAGKVFIGVQTDLGPFDFAATDAFASATAHRPQVMQFSQGWAHDPFRPEALNAIVERGMLPIVSWEPWDFTRGGRATSHGEQPEFRLSTIIGGTHDDYIRSWARGIAALPYPVVIRLAHEMNGFWYPWSEQSNGNAPGQYVAAWRHVYDLFAAEGADNAYWLWSPNVTYPGALPLADLYPGDAYVDWIGLSGYYGTAGREEYIGFEEIFAGTLAELASFTRKPVVITETGATNATGRQAEWVKDMFTRLPAHPEVIGVVWFEVDNEVDWRIAAAPQAAHVFAAEAASPTYDVEWTPNGIPRTAA